MLIQDSGLDPIRLGEGWKVPGSTHAKGGLFSLRDIGSGELSLKLSRFDSTYGYRPML